MISDIADAVALLKHGKGAHLIGEERPVLRPATRRIRPQNIHSRYYLRLTVQDRPGVLARVASVMARHRVSIASVLQSPAETPGAASLVLTTHESNERAIGETLKELRRLPSLLDVPLLLRIGDFSE